MSKQIIDAKLFNGSITVYEDYVEITRSGLMPMFYRGYTGGKKKIPIRSITAVEFKKQGMKQGFIHFSVGGEGNLAKSYDAIVKDENTVTYTPSQTKKAEAIRDAVEELIFKQGQTQTNNTQQIINPASPVSGVSAADELLKLKSLLDAGALTQEEFDTAKKRLLNP